MRALCQRVSQASVSIDGEVVSRIDQGLLVLLGILRDDDEGRAAWLAEKTLALRIFADASKPMNRSVVDVDGSILVVSQFTLAADTSRGNRPGFGHAAEPALAEALYEHYVSELKNRWPKALGLSDSTTAPSASKVKVGVFGANMQVALTNDGPVTILLER